jgi:hypothetical protein
VDAVSHPHAARLRREGPQSRQSHHTAIGVRPALAALIGWALYFTDDESGKYDFASAFHIPTYIFIALLVAMFLALMNSVDDIIRDRVVLHRERNLDVRPAVLHLREVQPRSRFLRRCSARSLSSWATRSSRFADVLALFRLDVHYGVERHQSRPASFRLRADAKTAANFVPLVLIPQLIFGGALIKYEEMNRNLDMIYTFHRWFSTHPEAAAPPRATTPRCACR